ncbi:uncharacterized protein LOC108669796 [Hyalella azteca]|uniref:E3 ubiquitin-protein ligase n=1 Tax=Hyalella azteca TaxID=294128 RepID=A0A8B7NGE2_HYAAZ|nr:uncharacterized protein LOC108669796 [Hyalella azteca]
MHGSDGLVSAMAGLDLQGRQPACAATQGGAGDKRPLGQRGDVVLGATACHDSDDEDSRCAVCFLTMVHPVRLPCDHVFCFLCVKPLLRVYPLKVSPNAPTELLTAPTDNRELNYQWFYEGRNGWWQYDARTNKEIEDAYQSEATTCQVLVVGLVFVVDFTRMLQYRIRDPSKRRKIKRDLSDAPMKGIAGISASRLDGREEDVGHHDAHLPRVDEHHMSPPLHHRQHEYQTPHVGAQVSRLDVHGIPPYVHQIDDLDVPQATHHSAHPVHQIPHHSRHPPPYLTDPPTDAPPLRVTHHAEAAGASVGGMGYDEPGRRPLWMGRSGTRQPRSPPVRPPPPTVSSRFTGDLHGDACPSPPVGLPMNQCPWAAPQQHCHPSHSLRGVPSHSRVTERPFHSRVTEGPSQSSDGDQHDMPEEFVLPEDLPDDLSSSQGAVLGVIADSLPRIHLPQLDQRTNCCQCHRCHLMPGCCHLCRQLHSQAQCLDNGICPSFGECPQHCDCPGLSCDCIGPSCKCPRSSCHCPGTSCDCPRPSCDCNRSTRPASEVNLRRHGAHVCCRCSSRHRPAHPPSCRLPTLTPGTDEDPGDEGQAGTDPSLPD